MGDNPFAIPERFLRNNTPIKLFEQDGKEIAVSLLGSGVADNWAVEAREIDLLNGQLNFLSTRLRAAEALRNRAPLDLEDPCPDVIPGQDVFDKIMEKVRSVQVDILARTRKSLMDYAPAVLTQEVLDKATPPQIAWAWQLLKQHTDPFLATSSLLVAAMTSKTTQTESSTEASGKPQ